MEDRMVLQLFPQDFVVDDHPGHRDPRKMLASRLEINVHLVTASIQEHNAIIGAVNAAHLAVEESVFEGARRLLRRRSAGEPPRGHRRGRYRRALHRTRDLLRRRHAPRLHRPGLRRSLHPRSRAGSLPQLRGRRTGQNGIRLRAVRRARPRIFWWNCPPPEIASPREAPRQIVNRILAARTEELFRFVRGEFARVRHGTRAHRRRLPHRRRRQTARPVRCRRGRSCNARRASASPRAFRTGRVELNDPAWCTAAGLAMYSAKLKQHALFKQRAMQPGSGRC